VSILSQEVIKPFYSNDFRVLKSVKFPKINLLNIDEFVDILKNFDM